RPPEPPHHCAPHEQRPGAGDVGRADPDHIGHPDQRAVPGNPAGFCARRCLNPVFFQLCILGIVARSSDGFLVSAAEASIPLLLLAVVLLAHGPATVSTIHKNVKETSIMNLNLTCTLGVLALGS